MSDAGGPDGGRTATVRVSRDSGRSADRSQAYMVSVDGTQVGELGRGATQDFPVAAGRHVLWVGVDGVESRQWDVALAAGDTVQFSCRSRTKWANHVDLYLADPTDNRAGVRPPPDVGTRDTAKKQRVVTRDGRVLFVWAHRSGYLRSIDPGASSGNGDAFFVELALYVLVMPVLGVLRWVRHRLLFRRGWSVGVVRNRRFLWPKKVGLDRYRTEAEARAKAEQVIAELEGRSPAP